MYKLDNLLGIIRVSDENSSVTPAIQYFNDLVQLQTFLRSEEQLKSTSSTFNPFWYNLLFFMHLLICFQSKITVKVKSTTKWALKRLKLGKVSSFHPHSMCKKVERVTAKTGCTSCTKRTISFKYRCFIWKLVCYKGISFFWNHLNSIVFLCSKCTIESHIINFQPFLISFVIFHAFTDYFEL